MGFVAHGPLDFCWGLGMEIDGYVELCKKHCPCKSLNHILCTGIFVASLNFGDAD